VSLDGKCLDSNEDRVEKRLAKLVEAAVDHRATREVVGTSIPAPVRQREIALQSSQLATRRQGVVAVQGRGDSSGEIGLKTCIDGPEVGVGEPNERRRRREGLDEVNELPLGRSDSSKHVVGDQRQIEQDVQTELRREVDVVASRHRPLQPSETGDAIGALAALSACPPEITSSKTGCGTTTRLAPSKRRSSR
jgi:hypothetical protein